MPQWKMDLILQVDVSKFLLRDNNKNKNIFK